MASLNSTNQSDAVLVADAPEQAPDDHAPDDHGHATTACLNCGHAVPVRYCGRCGQDAHHTHRLTLKDMLHDIPHSIWHVDKGILFTLKTMIRRPGPTIRTWLAGQRVDHFRPLSLLLVITSFYAVVSSLLHIEMLPPRDPTQPAFVYELQQAMSAFMMKYLAWIYIATVPIWALFARLFLRRGGYNYAECLIIVAFLTAINNFFTFLLLPVSYAYSGTAQIGRVSVVFTGLIIAYSTWAYGSLLTHTTLSRAGRLWRGFLTYMLGYLTVALLGTGIGYALNWEKVIKSFRAQMQQQRSAAKSAAKPAAKPAAPAPARR